MSGLIVVGVDGSQSSLDALRWAAAQARLTGASIEVVTTWEYPNSFAWAPPWPPEWDPGAEAKKALAGVLDEVLGSDSGIEVRQVVLEGHAAPALVHASENADLLVVGSRGHGEFVGMLLGSVSEHCSTHAPCPVVIVRRRKDDKA